MQPGAIQVSVGISRLTDRSAESRVPLAFRRQLRILHVAVQAFMT